LVKGASKRGVSPSSINTFPPLLGKERGIKGVRLIKLSIRYFALFVGYGKIDLHDITLFS